MSQTAQSKSKIPPVRSMTGYGRAVAEDGRKVTAEIRAVNGRFFKLNVKLPGRYGALEDRIKSLINDLGVKRGSIDVNLFFEDGSEEGGSELNERALAAYAKQAKKIAKKLKLKGGVSLQSLMNLPSVIKRIDAKEDLEQVWTLSRSALDEALSQFNVMREKEGAMMAADIRAQLAGLAAHRDAIREVAPEALKATVQRFKDRIQKLLADAAVNAPLNNDVIERETILATDRTDVSEELARLESHFQQMESTLVEGGETGKKLDFLTQELFRETNTIGSKANDDRITYRVVDMKGLIEKIREQVQNLE
ncbi:MAG: YicC/YloC family endoribonuclease [Planctomycetota bacterium]